MNRHILIFSTAVILCFVGGPTGAKSQENQLVDLVHSANTAYELVTNHDLARIRSRRGVKDEIEKRFQEFSDKLGKLPDQLGDSFKKFLEERGISLESIQNILKEIWESMQKLVEEVKKAMNS